jgi:hypothetical protein
MSIPRCPAVLRAHTKVFCFQRKGKMGTPRGWYVEVERIWAVVPNRNRMKTHIISLHTPTFAHPCAALRPKHDTTRDVVPGGARAGDHRDIEITEHRSRYDERSKRPQITCAGRHRHTGSDPGSLEITEHGYVHGG